MVLRQPPDPQVQNQDAYDDLVVAIEASEGALSLLIAVCDDSNLRDEIIGRYEAELEAEMRCYRVQLDREEPSLKRAIAQTVETDQYLQQGGRAVFTVFGADTLLRIHLRADESGQTQLEKFLGYLQWTREGLREFRYPIVLWVTHSVLTQISTKSPDFWSWRKGTFRFTSSTIPVPMSRALINSSIRSSNFEENLLSSLEDLQNLVAETEKNQGTKAPLLATLYDQIAQAYQQRIEKGEAPDLEQDFSAAIDYFGKAISLEIELNLSSSLINTFTNLGSLYHSQSHFKEAIQCHENSLIIARKIGDSLREAISLINISSAYDFLGQYQQVIELSQQSLDIQRNAGDRRGEAKSLGNLGNAYDSLGQYQMAIEFHQQSLEICREVSDRQGEAASLGSLGNAYYSLGQYQEALECYQQSLGIQRDIGDRRGEASSLNNLGNIYCFFGQDSQAIECYQQSLEIFQRIGDRQGKAMSLGNLGNAYYPLGQYQEALECYQQSLEIFQQIGDCRGKAMSLISLGSTYYSLGRYREALKCYQRALEIQRAIDDRIEEARTLFNLGVIWSSLGKVSEAVAAYQSARTSYQTIGLENEVQKVDKALKELTVESGN